MLIWVEVLPGRVLRWLTLTIRQRAAVRLVKSGARCMLAEACEAAMVATWRARSGDRVGAWVDEGGGSGFVSMGGGGGERGKFGPQWRSEVK